MFWLFVNITCLTFFYIYKNIFKTIWYYIHESNFIPSLKTSVYICKISFNKHYSQKYKTKRKENFKVYHKVQ